MPKPKKPLTFAERLERTMERHNRRQQKNMELFRREQKRQGLKPDQPINVMGLIKKRK